MNEEKNTDIKKLNPFEELVSVKEMTFCIEYVSNGFNIYQAALKAGYSKNYAKSKSYLLMEKVGIKRLINKLLKERNEKIYEGSIADEKELREFWTNIVRGSLPNPEAVPYKEYVEDEVAQLSFLKSDGADERPAPYATKNIPLSMRLKASEMLYKAQTGFIENTNADIKITFEEDEDDE